MQAWLDEHGLSAVLAAAQPHHARMRLADVICAVRCEHERVHAIRQPLALAAGAAAAVPPEASVALNLALDAGAPERFITSCFVCEVSQVPW